MKLVKFIILSILLFPGSSVFAQQQFVPNYDESKVPDFILPDVLRAENGTAVKNKRQWENMRRLEVLRLFEDHVYGKVPKDFDAISFTLVNEDKEAMGGLAHLKEVKIDVRRNRNTVSINLVMFVPNNVDRPGVFLLINHRDISNTDPSRNTKAGYWPAELVVQRGYAIAAFHVSDVAPDNKDTFHQEVLTKLYPEQLGQKNGMMALGAWGWGASRIMDYLQKDKSVDASKVAVIGHSRSGKASLWCGAQDTRFAMVISNQSGCGGAALTRRMFGETLLRMNSVFPHWLTENNMMYDDNVDASPVDQHMLMALIAPRAVLVGSAQEDLWADPKGEFLSLKYAEPVYRLYKIAPLPVNEHPGPDSPVQSTHMSYHMRTGKHDLTPYDWEQYINFADKYYRKN
jgi:hypothetical protein